MTREIDRCRICGGATLTPILDLGRQMLTGVFPLRSDIDLISGPLRLVKCMTQGGCGLVQLAHSYDPKELYGSSYGYRSGLNESMVNHLKSKVARVLGIVDVQRGDLVVDVGSNDGTTLAAFPESLGADLLGIDPTASKFRKYYRADIGLCADFFSADVLRTEHPGKPVRILTSFSMLYDLESPLAFMQDVYDVMADDGVWVFEQSYLPAMLEALAYDTVCHEHLEYYALRQIKWMTDQIGFTIIDLEFNDINGGSFSVTAAKAAAGLPESPEVDRVIESERLRGLDTLAPYAAFAERVAGSRADLRAFLQRARSEGKSVAALGASTKGNVLLQYCGISPGDIQEVGEVNPDKFGSLTPGTWLPIRPQAEVMSHGHDYYLVLPWHFRNHFLANPAFNGKALVFPLPELAVVNGTGGMM